MMGRKQILNDGLEYDVVFARGIVSFHHKFIKYTKRKMNKRMRRELKKELYKEV